jgi:hypothetical protein
MEVVANCELILSILNQAVYDREVIKFYSLHCSEFPCIQAENDRLPETFLSS